MDDKNRNHSNEPNYFQLQRDQVLREAFELSGRYSKAILTLSGGSLALSITFLDKIAKEPQSWTVWLLGSSWSALIVAIVLELWALSKQYDIKEDEIEAMRLISEFQNDHWHRGGDKATASADKYNEGARKVWRLSWISRFALTIGVLLLCLFSIVNL